MNKHSQVDEIAPHVVVHAMREALRRAARLLSFGTSVMYADHNSVFDEQAALAIDDIVSFALHVRRAIELLKARSQFLSLSLETGNGPVANQFIGDTEANGQIRLLDLLGRIVHSTRLGISLTEADTERTRSARNSVIGPPDFYPHHFWIKSDRPEMYTVSIESFALTYIARVEPKLDSLC